MAKGVAMQAAERRAEQAQSAALLARADVSVDRLKTTIADLRSAVLAHEMAGLEEGLRIFHREHDHE